LKSLRIGIIPLTDAAPIVAAHEHGFFARHGLAVELSREPSWATVRDKLAAGALDAAHLLAPMALAASLGIGPYAEPIATGLSLGLGGDAICVSQALRARIPVLAGDAIGAARALAGVVAERRALGAPPLRLATVFPFSMHEYLLRDWLATAGIAPDRDVEIRVVPPPRMVEALEAGTIDGFCVGEPWSSVAVRQGTGSVVATAQDLWPHAPEKVLGVRLAWADRNAETHRALLRALIEAARWCTSREPLGAAATLSDWIGAERAPHQPALLVASSMRRRGPRRFPTSTASRASRRPSRGARTPPGSSCRCCAGDTSRSRSTCATSRRPCIAATGIAKRRPTSDSRRPPSTRSPGVRPAEPRASRAKMRSRISLRARCTRSVSRTTSCDRRNAAGSEYGAGTECPCLGHLRAGVCTPSAAADVHDLVRVWHAT
jgi:ABC-type nitrate/sulfonate/bicarbonate transport system substrate-binding protein